MLLSGIGSELLRVDPILSLRDLTSSEAGKRAGWVIDGIDSSLGRAVIGSRRVRDLLPDDLRNMVERSQAGRLRWLIEVAAKIALYPRVRAVIFYRFGQVLSRGRLLPLAYALQARAIRGRGAEISPLADIGPGLCLVHSVGIVVGPSVTAGANLRLYHGVTLGDGSLPGQPILGSDVMIGAGAAVLGGSASGIEPLSVRMPSSPPTCPLTPLPRVRPPLAGHV